MKKSTLLTMMVILLSFVVVSAFAQTEEPPKNQNQTQTQTATQTQTKAQNQEQVTAQASHQTQAQNQSESEGQNQVQAKHQDQVQHQAANKPVEGEDDADKANEQTMTQKQLRLRKLNYGSEDCNGTDAYGGIHRNGGDNAGVGGPHGSDHYQGGDADELEKFLGIDEMLFLTGEPSMNMARSGDANMYNPESQLGRSEGPWGPFSGVEEPTPYGHVGDHDAAFGPMPDASFGHAGEVGFNPGGSDDTGGSGEASPSGTLNGLRQGRR